MSLSKWFHEKKQSFKPLAVRSFAKVKKKKKKKRCLRTTPDLV